MSLEAPTHHCWCENAYCGVTMLIRKDLLSRRLLWVVLVLLGVGSLVLACGGGAAEMNALKEGKANLTVVYRDQAGVGVQEAADELVRVLSALTGQTFPAPVKVSKGGDLSGVSTEGVILLGSGILGDEPVPTSDVEALGDEDFITLGKSASGKSVYQIAGKSETGVQYGVYTMLRTWGVRYFHPADTYTPSSKEVILKMGDKQTVAPAMQWRGFHHHTQHPIPMSVYLLEPEDKHLPRVQEYMRWLVRNRQNVLGWHYLKTVDQEKWIPYVKKMKALGDPYGVKLVLTISFADQQQNNYRLIDNLKSTAEEQTKSIKDRLDKLIEGGFAYFVVQFGTSEFTKVSDDVAIRWLNTAAEHLKSKNVPVFAWIHTAGELKADAGGYYYHLPEKANPAMGAYVHTTMFYDMKNPAPVYSNENFNHQMEFLKRVNGKRPVVYFPETAWWLGFDNNLPLALPITGYSRGLDILELLKPQKIQGHVTFTTGMEWGYWKYDHYLTQVTFDNNTTWEAYLKDFTSIFGSSGETVNKVLNDWTQLQVRDFYTDKPDIYFYLSGELLQDELGQQAGVLARRPKRAFTEIVNLKADEYAKWEKEDLAKLKAMYIDYKKLYDMLPEKADDSWGDLTKKLYLELHTTLKLYIWRIEHTILLYESVQLTRAGREDGGEGANSDKAARDKAKQDSQAKIDAAKAITQRVLTEVGNIQDKVYRYPKEILYTERSSLTSYPFGYLWETSTAFFWKRRDDQAERLLKKLSGSLKEEWGNSKVGLLFRAKKDDVGITDPKNPLVNTALGPFIPGFLVAASSETVADGKVTEAWSIALDRNTNDKPDAETVYTIENGSIQEKDGQVTFTGDIKLYQLTVVDSAGNELGVLGLEDMQITFNLKRSGDKLTEMTSGVLRAKVVLENLVVIATQVAGLERDGLLQILADVIGFDPKSPPRDFIFEISLKVMSKVE